MFCPAEIVKVENLVGFVADVCGHAACAKPRHRAKAMTARARVIF